MKRVEKWWIVVINLGGITGPICCTKKSENSCWDRSGNYDARMKEGVNPIGGSYDCIQFESQNKHDAELFALGAKELAKRLTYYLSP